MLKTIISVVLGIAAYEFLTSDEARGKISSWLKPPREAPENS